MKHYQPSDATHEWTAAKHSVVHRFYKKVNGEWFSYSEMFQIWRKSQNEPSWFIEETNEGYFVKIKGK